MIITDTVKVNLNYQTKRHFHSLGYNIDCNSNSLEVKVMDLMKNSSQKVDYQCDKCKKIMTTKMMFIFSRLERQKTNKTYCHKCTSQMRCGERATSYKHGNKRYSEYMAAAIQRGLNFNISVGEFESITKKPCHYCGGFSSDFGFKYEGNGVDRKRSDRGYFISNCVPCCGRCNIMKGKIPYAEFKSHIRKISKTIGELK